MYPELTERFKSLLQFEHIPVGMAFVEEVPVSVEHKTTYVPSACTFWRLAEQGVFYANGPDHKECPVGMMTMGFDMPEPDQARAQGLVGMMASVQYFSPAEVAVLPTVKKPHEYIVYGRLDQMPVAPDAILCRLNPQQAMLIAEAMGKADWLQGGQTAFGRPTCAVIPRTLQVNEVSMSFGCVGARTYVEMTPGEMIATIPGNQFSDIVDKLDTIVNANNALAPFHASQKATYVA